jgi:hypothetical protein
MMPLALRLYSVDDRMINECTGVDGMRIGRGNRSTRRKPTPVPLCETQTPHDLGSKPGRHGGKPMTNRLSYGKASYLLILVFSPGG